MNNPQPPPIVRVLIGYYGILQSSHLFLLARAGWFVLQGRAIPFPAPPPPGGWSDSALPFLLGMGLVDLFAIGLGLVFVYNYFLQDRLLIKLGLISLTAALSSGLIYLVGTIPSGAWQTNPVAYLVVVVFFCPIVPFFFLVLRKNQTNQKTW
jgi:hypothetical protein